MQNALTAIHPILVVEDQQDVRDLVKMVLELRGFKVVTANNGQEALDLLRRRVIEPALILLDMFMPVMTGWEFLEKIADDPPSATARSIPIVVTTASGDPATKPRLNQVKAFLAKPVEMTALIDCVRKFSIAAI